MAEAVERAPMGGRLAVMGERWKVKWNNLKRRVTPQHFPQAWFLFALIILIITGAMITGWCGLAVETARHQALANAPSADTAISQPAPPDLQVAGGGRLTSMLTPPGLVAATVGVDEGTVSPQPASTGMEHPQGLKERSAVEDSLGRLTLTVTEGYTVETAVAKGFETTIYVTVTAHPIPFLPSSSPHPSPSSSSSLIHTSTPNLTPGPHTSTSTSTSTSPTLTPTRSETTPSASTPPENTPPKPNTGQDAVYCPWTERPKIWTPCADGATPAPAATTTAESAAAAADRPKNPFTAARLMIVALWNKAEDLVRYRAGYRRL